MRKNRQCRADIIGLLVPVFAMACSRGSDERPPFHPGRAIYDTTNINLTNFANEPAIQQRVLMMPFGEAAARLGSLRFVAVSNFEFSRGGDVYEQRDHYAVRQDVDGNFHVRLETPTSQVEFYLLGEDVYVRLDKGQLRQKPRREVETEANCEIAFSSLRQTLTLFRPRLTFIDPAPADLQGRATIRYRLDLAPADTPVPDFGEPPEGVLPLAPPPRWRELAHPLDVSGEIWLDKATGVVLRAEIRGRLEIPDRDVRPTQLVLAYSAKISDIGKLTNIEVPKAIAEYRRRPPPRDQLGFFRDHLLPPLSTAAESNHAD